MPYEEDQFNPTFLPDKESRRRSCPKCGCRDFGGRRIQGVATFTCDKCKNVWTGGLPTFAPDPSAPVMPIDPRDRPTVSFEPYPSKGGGTVFKEERRPADLTQGFRKGSPIPKNEDE